MQTVDYGALGRRLRQARTQAHMSQKEVAEHLGVTASALSQYESGKRKIGALALERLARLYGRPLSSLFAEEGGEERPDWERALLGKTFPRKAERALRSWCDAYASSTSYMGWQAWRLRRRRIILSSRFPSEISQEKRWKCTRKKPEITSILDPCLFLT